MLAHLLFALAHDRVEPDREAVVGVLGLAGVAKRALHVVEDPERALAGDRDAPVGRGLGADLGERELALERQGKVRLVLVERDVLWLAGQGGGPGDGGRVG